jgi:hypothetical protein
MTSTPGRLVRPIARLSSYVERVSSAGKDAPPTSPPELLLAPVESWLGTSPIQAKRRRIRRRRHACVSSSMFTIPTGALTNGVWNSLAWSPWVDF